MMDENTTPAEGTDEATPAKEASEEGTDEATPAKEASADGSAE